MDYIKIKSLPKVSYAHSFSTEKYNNLLRKTENLTELTCVTDGELAFWEDGVRYTAHTGDFICNLFQKDRKIEAMEFHSHHTVGFEVSFDVSSEPMEEYIPMTAVLTLQEPEKYKKIIDEIIRIDAISAENQLKCAGLFLQLLCGMSKEAAKNTQGALRLFNPYVKKAKRYIYENSSRMIRQDEIAAYLKITPEYLCSVFKKETGETIMHYINRIKLEKISSLMEREGITLNKAAELFGYTDASYVSRLYKKYFGISISQGFKQNALK